VPRWVEVPSLDLSDRPIDHAFAKLWQSGQALRDFQQERITVALREWPCRSEDDRSLAIGPSATIRLPRMASRMTAKACCPTGSFGVM